MTNSTEMNIEKDNILIRIFIFIGILLIIFSIGATIYFVKCEIYGNYLIKDDVWGSSAYHVDMMEGRQYHLSISCTGRGPDIIDIKIVDGSTSEIILDLSRECLYSGGPDSVYFYKRIPIVTCQKSGGYDIITTASDSKRDYQIEFAEKSVSMGTSLFILSLILCLFYPAILIELMSRYKIENNNYIVEKVTRCLLVLFFIMFFVGMVVNVISRTYAEMAVFRFGCVLGMILIAIIVMIVFISKFFKKHKQKSMSR